MKIVEMGKPLTKEELEGIQRADKYLNNWGGFCHDFRQCICCVEEK